MVAVFVNEENILSLKEETQISIAARISTPGLTVTYKQ